MARTALMTFVVKGSGMPELNLAALTQVLAVLGTKRIHCHHCADIKLIPACSAFVTLQGLPGQADAIHASSLQHN